MQSYTHRDLHNTIQDMLNELGVSHLRIMDSEVYDHDIDSEMSNINYPSFGLDIEKIKEGYFVREVVEGSAAQNSGLRRGDKALMINNIPFEMSPLQRPSGAGGVFRIHPRSPVQLTISRKGAIKNYYISPTRWNRISASEVSQKVFHKDGKNLCYIHLWHLAHYDMMVLLKKFLSRTGNCHGLILDLRGFGGAIMFLKEFLQIIKKWNKPIVAIIDKETRSIKETISFHLKDQNLATLVGEKTVGSCLASRFFDLPDGSKMIIPTENMTSLTKGTSIEGKGIKPHIKVPMHIPSLNGQDPHLEKAIQVLSDKLKGKSFGLGGLISRFFN